MMTFSSQAQLVDLGLSLACTYTNMCTNLAMSGAFAVTSVAFAAPFMLAASARPFALLPGREGQADAFVLDPYSAYRSDGGHATTLVIMGQMPSEA